MKAFITGITGQDGSYLAELLLAKGYEVHGMKRRSSSFNTARIDHIFDDLHLHYGDMTDSVALSRLVKEIQPDEVYNLAAQSHVAVSFESPDYTATCDALGTLRLLEAIRAASPTPFIRTKFYQASTSELFGNSPAPQNEETRFAPESPYGTAKLYAYHITKNYRTAYNMFAVNGILFNHESPRRGETFVTRKVTMAVAEYARFSPWPSPASWNPIQLGNTTAKRDWTHAKDMVEGMWMMLQRSDPADFVMGSGKSHTIRELVDVAFQCIGVKTRWNEAGNCYDNNSGTMLVQTNARYKRPNEVWNLQSDPSKVKEDLGWEPKISFKQLIAEMVQADYDS